MSMIVFCFLFSGWFALDERGHDCVGGVGFMPAAKSDILVLGVRCVYR